MAVIRYYPSVPLDLIWSGGAGVLVESSDTFAEFTTSLVGGTQRFIGHDFVVEDSKLVSGIVTEFVFKAEGEVAYQATGYDWDLSQGRLDVFGGSDKIIGTTGDDALSGHAGDDFIRGGRGDDLIWGDEGTDSLRGGPGADLFFFGVGHGRDTIFDFDMLGEVQDRISIALPIGHDDFRIKQRGDNTVLNFGDGDKLILHDIDRHDLSRDNFSVRFYAE